MKLCLVCNNKLGWVKGKTVDKNFVCSKCLKKYGLKSQVSKMTSGEIKERTRFIDEATSNVGDYLYVNENTKEWMADKIYKFEDIVSFELVETNVSHVGYCANLYIKITVNDISNPVTFIKFFTRKTYNNYKLYKKVLVDANKCAGILEIISK